jgi:hypothetical protein
MSLKLLEKKEQTKPKTTNRENNKDQGQDQWDQDQKNYAKNGWNKNLVLWKGK